MFVSPAYAQGAPSAGGSDFLISLLPFILIFAIMYFLIIRPQQRRLKDHRDMVSNVRRGDEVVTQGGIIGKVTRVTSDDELQVEIADGVRVKMVRSTISQVRTKGEPVKEGASG